MAMDKDEMIATLNTLVETCKDGQNGFRTAAEGVKNAELTSSSIPTHSNAGNSQLNCRTRCGNRVEILKRQEAPPLPYIAAG